MWNVRAYTHTYGKVGWRECTQEHACRQGGWGEREKHSRGDEKQDAGHAMRPHIDALVGIPQCTYMQQPHSLIVLQTDRRRARCS